MRTINDYDDYDYEKVSGKQRTLLNYFRISRLKKLDEDETFLEEWLEPNRYANT